MAAAKPELATPTSADAAARHAATPSADDVGTLSTPKKPSGAAEEWDAAVNSVAGAASVAAVAAALGRAALLLAADLDAAPAANGLLRELSSRPAGLRGERDRVAALAAGRRGALMQLRRWPWAAHEAEARLLAALAQASVLAAAAEGGGRGAAAGGEGAKGAAGKGARRLAVGGGSLLTTGPALVPISWWDQLQAAQGKDTGLKAYPGLNVPPKQLKFAAGKLKKPLTAERGVEPAEGVRFNEKLLSVTGERSSKLSRATNMARLYDMALRDTALRVEAWAQLLRHVSPGNTNRASVAVGWRVLAMLAWCAPPPEELRPCVLHELVARRSAGKQVADRATVRRASYVLRALSRQGEIASVLRAASEREAPKSSKALPESLFDTLAAHDAALVDIALPDGTLLVAEWPLFPTDPPAVLLSAAAHALGIEASVRWSVALRPTDPETGDPVYVPGPGATAFTPDMILSEPAPVLLQLLEASKGSVAPTPTGSAADAGAASLPPAPLFVVRRRTYNSDAQQKATAAGGGGTVVTGTQRVLLAAATHGVASGLLDVGDFDALATASLRTAALLAYGRAATFDAATARRGEALVSLMPPGFAGAMDVAAAAAAEMDVRREELMARAVDARGTLIQEYLVAVHAHPRFCATYYFVNAHKLGAAGKPEVGSGLAQLYLLSVSGAAMELFALDANGDAPQSGYGPHELAPAPAVRLHYVHLRGAPQVTGRYHLELELKKRHPREVGPASLSLTVVSPGVGLPRPTAQALAREIEAISAGARDCWPLPGPLATEPLKRVPSVSPQHKKKQAKWEAFTESMKARKEAKSAEDEEAEAARQAQVAAAKRKAQAREQEAEARAQRHAAAAAKVAAKERAREEQRAAAATPPPEPSPSPVAFEVDHGDESDDSVII